MKIKFYHVIILAIFIAFIVCNYTLADSTKKDIDAGWIESSEFKFDGKIDFQQDKLGRMDELIARYKRGEKGVKIFAIGKIIDNHGKMMENFDNVPAKIITMNNSDYFQFEKGLWRFISSTNPLENYRKIFKRKNQ